MTTSATGRFSRAGILPATGRVARGALSVDPVLAIATISPDVQRIAVTRMSATVVDNNLRFAGAETQKTTALTNLANKYHNLNMFLESFGNGSTLGSWDGISDVVGDLPALDLSNWTAHWDLLDPAIMPDTWGVFGYRIPWQFTGLTDDFGVTVKSTSADYNNDGRRLLTDKVPQFIEWVARWSSVLMAAPYSIRAFYQGSECKNFQGVRPVVVDSVVIREGRDHSWEWDSYAGTPGRADMGIYAYYDYYRQGLMEGALRAGVPWGGATGARCVSPYPVISHQGDAGPGQGAADAINFDSLALNLEAGPLVNFAAMNGNNMRWGWPALAATVLTAEYIRQQSENAISSDEWDFGSDFGTFNEDGVPTPDITDHDLAYERAKGHFSWYRSTLEQFGYNWNTIVKRLPEYYAKAQYEMDQPGAHFVEEQYRDDYQAGIRFAFLLACYEDGIEYPDMWSFFGRGDQSTTAQNQEDPNQWYGGVIVRTVGDNNDHVGSAIAGGGEAQSALGLIAALKDHFPPGTELHEVTFNETGWRGLASATHAVIVNEQGTERPLRVDDLDYTFAPYERKLIVRGEGGEEPVPEVSLLWNETYEVSDGAFALSRMPNWYINQIDPTEDSGAVTRPGNGASQNRAHNGLWAQRTTIGVTADLDAGARTYYRPFAQADPTRALYYGSWFLIPNRVAVGTFWMHMQLKVRNELGGGQGVAYALYVYNPGLGQMAYRLTYKLNEDQGIAGPFEGGSNVEPYHEYDTTLLPENAWYHVEMLCRPAEDYTGQVAVRLNGVEIFNWENVITVPPGGGYYDVWHITNYGKNLGLGDSVGSGTANVNLYNDDVTIGEHGWIYGSPVQPWT